MTKMKIGGVILTGFGAWMLINKGLNLIGQISRDAKEASQWKAYYRNGGEDTIPPGYSRTTKYNDGRETTEEPHRNTPVNTSEKAVDDVIHKAVDKVFEKSKAPEGAKEGQEMASETEDIGSECATSTIDDISSRMSEIEKKQPSEYVNGITPDNAKTFMDYVRERRKEGKNETEIALMLGMPISSLREAVSDALDILAEKETEQ